MYRFALCVACACGSSPSPAVAPPSPPPAPPPADAAIAHDDGPSAELAAAPAWIFRYSAPPRVETWTLRFTERQALLAVQTAQGTTTYLGTATEDATLVVAVATPTAKLALDCKRARRAIGATCKAKKPPMLDVLDCFHPDFKEPMTFGAAPGVEYAASCPGYQRLP
jgi:hypothetical protein